MRSMQTLRHVTAALAVGTALVAAQPAAADTYTATNGTPINTGNLTLLGGSTIDLVATLVSGAFGVFNYTLFDAWGNQIWKATSGLIDGALNPATASYTVQTSGLYSFSAYVTAGNASVVATINAVPGPVAAAGVPGVLALMGYAAWRRRRSAAA